MNPPLLLSFGFTSEGSTKYYISIWDSFRALFVCMRPVTSIFVKKHFLATNVEQVEESTVSKEKHCALQVKKKKK